MRESVYNAIFDQLRKHAFEIQSIGLESLSGLRRSKAVATTKQK
jgi:hypothetical protein